MTTARQSWIAGLLTLALPGLGHLYVGLPTQAAIAFVLWVFAGVLRFVSIFWAPQPLNALFYWTITLGTQIGIAAHAWMKAASAPKPYALQPYNRWYFYCALIGLGLIALIPLQRRLVRDSLVQGFLIRSNSMEPTLRSGDYLFVDKRISARASAARGTLVAFRSPEEEGLVLLFRIVAVPGDTVQMIGGELFLNGQPTPEPFNTLPHGNTSEAPASRERMQQWQAPHYVGQGNAAYTPDLQNWGPLAVSSDSFLVLGDNRDLAYDSRYWGLLPRDNIIGRPRVVYWSYDPQAPIALPILLGVRWHRVGLPF